MYGSYRVLKSKIIYLHAYNPCKREKNSDDKLDILRKLLYGKLFK